VSGKLPAEHGGFKLPTPHGGDIFLPSLLEICSEYLYTYIFPFKKTRVCYMRDGEMRFKDWKRMSQSVMLEIIPRKTMVHTIRTTANEDLATEPLRFDQCRSDAEEMFILVTRKYIG
jgi:hypothetical protein